MLSRVANRITKQVRLTQLATQGFKATAVADASKKPSIGDAVTILQSKVSQINQVVSFFLDLARCPAPRNFISESRHFHKIIIARCPDSSRLSRF